eukprot:2806544-Prymnesium_polylepis.2
MAWRRLLAEAAARSAASCRDHCAGQQRRRRGAPTLRERRPCGQWPHSPQREGYPTRGHRSSSSASSSRARASHVSADTRRQLPVAARHPSQPAGPRTCPQGRSRWAPHDATSARTVLATQSDGARWLQCSTCASQ